MQPIKCLRNNDAMGVLFVGEPETIREDIGRIVDSAETFSLDLTNYGLCLQIKTLTVPIQATMFEHLAATGLIKIYAAEDGDYEIIHIFNLPIDLEKLNQAIGAYSYKSGTFNKAS